MSLFKRFSTTLYSRVEQLVNQIENHDAIIEAAIRDAKHSAAKARAQHKRVQQDGVRLQQKRDKLAVAIEQWQTRARRFADDETKALSCLQRKRLCQQQLSELEPMIKQHQQMDTRLQHDIKRAEEKITAISQQRHLMRTRQSAADALSQINQLDAAPDIDIDDTFERWETKRIVDIDDTFERWETKINEREFDIGLQIKTDDFEEAFIAEEEMEDLRHELHDLINKGKE